MATSAGISGSFTKLLAVGKEHGAFILSALGLAGGMGTTVYYVSSRYASVVEKMNASNALHDAALEHERKQREAGDLHERDAREKDIAKAKAEAEASTVLKILDLAFHGDYSDLRAALRTAAQQKDAQPEAPLEEDTQEQVARRTAAQQKDAQPEAPLEKDTQEQVARRTGHKVAQHEDKAAQEQLPKASM